MDHACAYDESQGVVRVANFVDVPKYNPDELKRAVARGPVSAAVEANNAAFKSYVGGIIDGGCGTQRDHAILIIGYGFDGYDEYWVVRNSWGPTWGEAGHFRILNTGYYDEGMCGINGDPSYPIIL